MFALLLFCSALLSTCSPLSMWDHGLQDPWTNVKKASPRSDAEYTLDIISSSILPFAFPLVAQWHGHIYPYIMTASLDFAPFR